MKTLESLQQQLRNKFRVNGLGLKDLVEGLPVSGMVAERDTALLRRIAVSAFQTYRYATQNLDPTHTWQSLPEDQQDGWLRAVVLVREVSEDCANVPWREIAKLACERAGYMWGEEAKQHIAWEAVCRHALQCMESEELTEDSVEEMEARWAPWAQRRLTA